MGQILSPPRGFERLRRASADRLWPTVSFDPPAIKISGLSAVGGGKLQERKIPTLAPLGESDLWTPMGSIGPQKSARVDRRRRFLQPGRAG